MLTAVIRVNDRPVSSVTCRRLTEISDSDLSKKTLMCDYECTVKVPGRPGRRARTFRLRHNYYRGAEELAVKALKEARKLEQALEASGAVPVFSPAEKLRESRKNEGGA